MARTKTRHTGVFSRKSTSRRHQGKYDVCYDILYTVKGKKIWEKIGWVSEGYSAELAKQIRAERIKASRHGSLAPQKDMTLNDAWSKYDEHHLTPNRRHQNRERNRYDKMIRASLGNLSLSKITPYELERYKNELGKSYAPATVKHALVLIRQIYNKMIDWELYSEHNPIRKVRLPKLDNARWRWLTEHEANMLLEALCERSRQWYCIALLSLHSGLRAGEVFRLTWSDIDTSQRTIRVVDPKHRTRTAYMTRTAADMLCGLDRGGKNELIFSSRHGELIPEVSHSFELAVDDVGLNDEVVDRRDKVVFHTLRHTYASWLALSGVELYVIAELLGHSTLEMTRRYSHLAPGKKQTAVDHIDRLFNRVDQ